MDDVLDAVVEDSVDAHESQLTEEVIIFSISGMLFISSLVDPSLKPALYSFERAIHSKWD